jgi:hypothetical protein
VSVNAFSQGRSSDPNSIGQILPVTCFKVVKDWLQSCLNSSRSNFEIFLQPFRIDIGFPVDEIYIRLNENTASGRIFGTGGGDVKTVPTAMIDAPSEIPNAWVLEVEQLAASILSKVKNLLVFAGGRSVLIKRSA